MFFFTQVGYQYVRIKLLYTFKYKRKTEHSRYAKDKSYQPQVCCKLLSLNFVFLVHLTAISTDSLGRKLVLQTRRLLGQTYLPKSQKKRGITYHSISNSQCQLFTAVIFNVCASGSKLGRDSRMGHFQ